MKKQLAQKILSYSVMGISMILIGILLIPLGILFVLVWAIWTAAVSYTHLTLPTNGDV